MLLVGVLVADSSIPRGCTAYIADLLKRGSQNGGDAVSKMAAASCSLSCFSRALVVLRKYGGDARRVSGCGLKILTQLYLYIQTMPVSISSLFVLYPISLAIWL